MIERWGGEILLGLGVALLAVGVFSAESATRIGLIGVGASLVVLAVVLSRIEGPLKIGPSGLETQLRAAQQKALAESQSLSDALTDGLDIRAVAAGRKTLKDAADPRGAELSLVSLLDVLREIDARQSPSRDQAPKEALFEAARGLMAVRRWSDAAEYLDRYLEQAPTDWEALFARATVIANARGGPASDAEALRAYSETIALAPEGLDPNLLARLLSYKAAMLKRLGRVVEAEADLNAAAVLATRPYERADIDYNLACVYAMTGRRDGVMAKLEALRGTGYLDAIRANAERYFAKFLGDPGFREAVGLSALGES